MVCCVSKGENISGPTWGVVEYLQDAKPLVEKIKAQQQKWLAKKGHKIPSGIADIHFQVKTEKGSMTAYGAAANGKALPGMVEFYVPRSQTAISFRNVEVPDSSDTNIDVAWRYSEPLTNPVSQRINRQFLSVSDPASKQKVIPSEGKCRS